MYAQYNQYSSKLGAWLRSPFERLEGWDEEVQYLDPRTGSGRGGGSAKRGKREEGGGRGEMR